MNIPVIFI